MSMVVFLDLNGAELHVDVDDAVQTMLAVASGEIDEKSLTSWLNMRVNFTPEKGS
jgi:prophage maintenance system killer protein